MTIITPCPYCGRQPTQADAVTRKTCAGCGATRQDAARFKLLRHGRRFSYGIYTSLSGSTAAAVYFNVSFDTDKWWMTP